MKLTIGTTHFRGARTSPADFGAEGNPRRIAEQGRSLPSGNYELRRVVSPRGAREITTCHTRRERTADTHDGRRWNLRRNDAATEEPWNSRGPDASSSSILTRSSRRRSHGALSESSLSLSHSLLLSRTHARTRARANPQTQTDTRARSPSRLRSLTHSRWYVRPLSLSLSRESVPGKHARALARARAALTNTINPL